MEKNLKIEAIIKSGIALGLKNFVSILLSTILYFLTFWIPYLNVGTTIAMSTLPLKMSEGETISPGDIFNEKYRKNMGEFLLLTGLLFLIVFMGYIFMIIPAIVMRIAYGYSIYFFIDKEITPTEALNISNKRTYGHKWNIFLAKFGFMIAAFIVAYVFSLILPILAVIPMILIMPILLGIDAYIYSQISDGTVASDAGSSDVIDDFS
ncbi:MAG: hypothetical protein AB8B74_05550 [Crocinitomicaceae bacterium]